ncbi:MAG: alpha-hydroxy acid oxidase [Actinomycetota bacterium]|nr:alpha-hydroxy acid oxidase [Actinomycetota bacterium]
MVQRRLPRPSEVLPLIGRPDRSQTRLQRRLARCASVADIRLLAKARVPRAVFDYTDGAAMSESTLNRSRDVYARVQFTPRVMRNVSEISLDVTMLGEPNALPFALAPTGFTRMMHYAGEPAVAQAAERFGLAYGLSTLGTTSIEDLAQARPGVRRWFQLYVSRERERAEQLMHRAQASGYDTLILTVDTAVGGIRRREIRDGLTIPPSLSVRTIADMATHPRWWLNVLTTEPLEFATLTSTGGTVGDLLTRVFDPGITSAEISWIRDNWNGSLMVKGVQSVEDARLVRDLGVDAVVLSNHGGRQLDKGNVPLEVLPEVVRAVGSEIEVYIDGGITSGTDIVAALAFGAQGTLVGRAYLYGLMAGGYDGVVRVLEILQKEIKTTMQLMGVTSVAELDPSMVCLRP